MLKEKRGVPLGCDVRLCRTGEEAAVLHGNRLIVCMDEVMGLAGHQNHTECEGGWAPWLIVLPRETRGRPVLSHSGAEVWV